jgi:hypothetical protein
MSPTVRDEVSSSASRSTPDNPLQSTDDRYRSLDTGPGKSLSLLKQLSFQHIKSQSTEKALVMPHNKPLDIESQGSRRVWRPEQSERFEDNPSGSRSGRGKSRSRGRREELLKDFEPSINDYDDIEEMVEDEVYFVKQKKGYLSIGFSMVQTVVLAAMMIQCGIAPLNLNPMIGPPPDALDYWGGKNSLKILEDNEEWRLVTPIFLHAGIIHLMCNVSVQLDVGEFFEREWGSGVWLYIYLVSAVGSSICSVCMMPDNISVGSSGAVMGLFGGKVSSMIIAHFLAHLFQKSMHTF